MKSSSAARSHTSDEVEIDTSIENMMQSETLKSKNLCLNTSVCVVRVDHSFIYGVEQRTRGSARDFLILDVNHNNSVTLGDQLSSPSEMPAKAATGRPVSLQVEHQMGPHSTWSTADHQSLYLRHKRGDSLSQAIKFHVLLRPTRVSRLLK